MASATPIDSLLDILELIGRIQRQVHGLTREAFIADADALDATAFRLLAIGEGCKSLDDASRERYPHVLWREIVAMRNLLAHEYFVLESEIIWETVNVGLPDLAEACRSELKRQDWPGAELDRL